MTKYKPRGRQTHPHQEQNRFKRVKRTGEATATELVNWQPKNYDETGIKTGYNQFEVVDKPDLSAKV